MDILEYFDTENETHVNAFIHLTEKGAWPIEFFNKLEKENIEMPDLWQITLMSTIAIKFMKTQQKKFEKK